MENILEVKDLRKKYSDFLLSNVNFTLPSGCIMGLIGPNGAGKTTLIKIIMNLIRADSGDVEVFGKTHRTSEKEIKSRIGYVGEKQNFYEDKKVKWMAKFISQFYSDWDEELFEDLLKRFSINPAKKARELSRGMRVKFSLSLALSHNPDLILLDEPTSGLDPVVRRELLDILLSLVNNKQKSVLISSHITDDISRIADYVVFLIDGKIVLNREKDVILSNWKRLHFRKEYLSEEILDRLIAVKKGQFARSGITYEYPEIEPFIRTAIKSKDVRVENLSLDDILITFVKESSKCSEYLSKK